MELKIRSDEALEIIKLGEMTQEEMLEFRKNHRMDAITAIKQIIGGYVSELITAAKEASVVLDLSYETVKNIPAALTLLYIKQHKWEYEDSRNKIVTCRTLAAYINLLIINYYGCSVNVKSYSNQRRESRPEMWADSMVLRLDNKSYSDMLPYVWEGANTAPIEVENGFVIDVTPIVEGFKRLTGVDLADEGLSNMILTLGEDASEEE